MTRRIGYGPHPSQHAELTSPRGRPRGLVVVVHGGFWRARYDLSLGRPLAADLVARGWTVGNLEYRRVGDGGGVPGTLDDVAAGTAALADRHPELTTVVALGHSAGGHLAAWVASRGRVSAVVAQAGVLDLRAAHRAGLGDGAVERFLGHPPGPADAWLDPIRQAPLPVPVWCVHARADDDVPLSQSADYVAAATGAGGRAELVEVDGDHMTLIDPESEAWRRQLALLDALG